MAKASRVEQLESAVQVIITKPGTRLPKIDADLVSLARVATELRTLPRHTFRDRLKFELVAFSGTAKPRPSPSAAIAIPNLTFKDTRKAIAFYEKAFGAREVMLFEVGGSIPHAEIMIGDSIIMMAEEWPEGGRFSAETLKESPVSIRLKVDDVDSFTERAVAAGLKIINPVEDQFYGHRSGNFVDPFGYAWTIYTLTEEMSVEEMHRRLDVEMHQAEEKKPAASLIPRGFRTLTPYIVARDAEGLIDFVTQVFDGQQTFRTVGGAGGVHAEVRVDDSMLMIGGGGKGLAWRGNPQPGAFHIYVRDCDAVYERALQAGATSINAPADQEYGERSASIKDAEGNFWYIATFKGKDYKWEGAPAIQPYLHPLRAEPVVNFLRRAFGAEELERDASPDGVIHHLAMKLGNSRLEMGEAHGPYQPMASMFYLYVPDCDLLYRRALEAGATSISPPTDQDYGDRSAGVKDPFGNQWYIATHIKDVVT